MPHNVDFHAAAGPGGGAEATMTAPGETGQHNFDMQAMAREDSTYVVMNGERYACTPEKYGPGEVETGDTARVFFVTGGPNLTSSFHPIGNVWKKLYPEVALDRPADPHPD